MTDRPDENRRFHRAVSADEKATLSALLRLKPETTRFIGDLESLAVQEMADGGMGSLLLIPRCAETVTRSFGRQIVAAEFTDNDGVLVSVTVNTDNQDRLYELDMWKVTFAPLLHWPDAGSIRIAEQKP
jgi:hypothetical protein